tara:strand:+ start:61 stop:597 length:537 start_codon:yes stop_codon:yes gene_type:complete
MMMRKNWRFFLIVPLTLAMLTSCGGAFKPKKVDTREVPIKGSERSKKNIEQGSGVSLKNVLKRGTNFEFSSSNPMWRASLEILDFLPLSTVDYSGGMIVSDWYTGDSSSESIKISIRFLSNEVRSDSLKIIVHKKKCFENQTCQTRLLNNSKISQELRSTILTKAAELEKESKKKKKN